MSSERTILFATRWSLVLCAFTSIVLVASLYWMASNLVLGIAGLPGQSMSLAEDIKRLEDVEVLRKVCVPLAEAMDSTYKARQDGAKFVLVGAGFLIVASGIGFLLSARLLRLVLGSGEATANSGSRLADKVFGFLLRALKGELRLWTAFWVIYVLPPVIYTGVAWGLKGMVSFKPEMLNLLILALVFATAVVQLIFSMIVVWRSAANADKKIWGILARGVVVLHSLYFAGRVSIGAWILGSAYWPFLLNGS